MAEDFNFDLGDRLPTFYDAAIAIFKVSQNPKRPKMKKVINAYQVALSKLWIQAFGNNHIMVKNSIIKKLEKLVNSYFNKVYKRAHMHKGDGRMGAGMSMRQLNKVKTISKLTRFKQIF